MLARSSIKYANLYSKLNQGPPTPFATGIGFSGSIGLIGLEELPDIFALPTFLGDPSEPLFVVFCPGYATTLVVPCLKGASGLTTLVSAGCEADLFTALPAGIF